MAEYADVTEQRRERGLRRDIVMSEGRGFARLRAGQIMTPLIVRMRILAELADRPEEFRRRSVRRRLTALDRALSDGQAAALDRAYTAFLTIQGKARGVNWSSMGSRSAGFGEPLTPGELGEVGAYRYARAKLDTAARQWLDWFLAVMSPWDSGAEPLRMTPDLIQGVRQLAEKLEMAYLEQN